MAVSTPWSDAMHQAAPKSFARSWRAKREAFALNAHMPDPLERPKRIESNYTVKVEPSLYILIHWSDRPYLFVRGIVTHRQPVDLDVC